MIQNGFKQITITFFLCGYLPLVVRLEYPIVGAQEPVGGVPGWQGIPLLSVARTPESMDESIEC